MATISDYFEQAQLSQAAYAQTLEEGMHGDAYPGYVTKLVGGGMSTEQAIDFANKYKVIDQYTDPENGFSGTVFQDTSGKVFMAMRGTQPSAVFTDWPTNIADIGSDGIAIDQAIAMYNWYQRLITPVGGEATQYIYHKEISALGEIIQPAWLEEKTVVVTGNGENEGGGLVGKSDIAVTGHSLGGHLAMIMSRIAPNLVTSTLTFNAPRFDTNLALDWSDIPFSHLTLSTTALTCEGFFKLLRDAEAENGGVKTSSTWDTGTIINTRIEGDVVSLIGNLPGAADQLQLFSESMNEGPIDAHLMPAITDALAVANLYAQAQADLSIDTITAILKASSNIIEDSLESAVAALGNIFVNGFTQREGNEYDSDRDLLYQDTNDITGAIPKDVSMSISTFITSAADGSDISLPSSQIENIARGNIAYRYALVNLNPFAILGADYSKFNQNGELDVYSSQNPKGQLSNQYLLDRADMLTNLIVMNINDGYNESIIRYKDLASDITVLKPELALSAPQKSIVFGSEKGDTVEGTVIPYRGDTFDDHLYGMGGNDTIKGHGGDDYIEGGKGRDTMYGGAGIDTFFVMGEDQDYDIFNGGDGQDTIQGGSGNDTIRLHNFNPSSSIEKIIGGGGTDIIAGTDDGDTIDLSATTLSGIARIEGGAGADTIKGTAAADVIYGGSLSALDDGSPDRLEGGAGNDEYHIGLGDTIKDSDGQGTVWLGNTQLGDIGLIQQGETGIYKNENGDIVAFYDSETKILQVSGQAGVVPLSYNIENFTSGNFGITLNEYIPPPADYTINWSGSTAQDWVEIVPQRYDPTAYNLYLTSYPQDSDPVTLHKQFDLRQAPALNLQGGGSGDYLIGFANHDHLQGGDGNDIIHGQITQAWWYSGLNDPPVVVPVFPDDPVKGDILDGGTGNDGIFGSHGDDQMAGGEGRDILTGRNGDDIMLGEGGNDILFGSPGADFLEGGDGDDALFGDSRAMEVTSDNLAESPWEFRYASEGFAVGCDIRFSVDLADPADAGNDVLSGGKGRDYLQGGAGDDMLSGGEDHDSLSGGAGDDHLAGGAGNDLLICDNGDGQETPYDGRDIALGGEGNDRIYGLGGDDILYGNEGLDVISGGSGNDILNGGSGDDLLFGLGGNDLLMGEEGADQLMGFAGDDTLVGGAGGDALLGDEGDDTLEGGSGSDYLQGGSGNDTLDGGYESDLLQGGSGNDRYRLSRGSGYDLIEDGAGANRILFGNGIGKADLALRIASYDSSGDVTFTPTGGDLWLWYGQNDGVLLRKGTGNINFTYQFADGSVLSHSELLQMIPADNGQNPPSGGIPSGGWGTSSSGSSGAHGNESIGVVIHTGTTVGPVGTDDYQVQQAINQWLKDHKLPGSGSDDLTMADGYEVTPGVLGSNYFGSDNPMEWQQDSSDFSLASGGDGGAPVADPAMHGADGAGRQLPLRDPLVMDLDGDGVEFIGLNGSNAYFDLDGDGFATRTAWLGGDDGFLTLDRNGDGKVNDISELFGKPNQTGYQELAGLDSSWVLPK